MRFYIISRDTKYRKIPEFFGSLAIQSNCLTFGLHYHRTANSIKMPASIYCLFSNLISCVSTQNKQIKNPSAYNFLICHISFFQSLYLGLFIQYKRNSCLCLNKPLTNVIAQMSARNTGPSFPGN